MVKGAIIISRPENINNCEMRKVALPSYSRNISGATTRTDPAAQATAFLFKRKKRKMRSSDTESTHVVYKWREKKFTGEAMKTHTHTGDHCMDAAVQFTIIIIRQAI